MSRRSKFRTLAIGALIALPSFGASSQPSGQERGQVTYSEDIAPIFRGYCESCHKPGGQGFEASGFDVRTYQGVMKGTKFGPVVIPGEPDASTLVALVDGRTSSRIRMPFEHHPLPGDLRENIWTWIFQGAKDD